MQDSNDKNGSGIYSGEKVIFPISLAFLILGAVGYLILQRDQWIFYAFAHLGATGVLGLFGSAAGVLAREKGRSYWRALSLGVLIPMISGIVAVLIYLWGVNGQLYCGGPVSLAVAAGTVIFYLSVKKKTSPRAGHVGQPLRLTES